MAWPASSPAALPGVQLAGGGAHGLLPDVQVEATASAVGSVVVAALLWDAESVCVDEGAVGSGATSGPKGVPISEGSPSAES